MTNARIPKILNREAEYLIAAGETHRGLQRPSNQDSLGVWTTHIPRVAKAERGSLFAVVDGMGGHAGSEEAARTITKSLLGYFSGAGGGPGRVEALLHEANQRVLAAQANDVDRAKMGAVVSAVWMDDEAAEIFHVGDTRVYGVDGDRIEQLTVDEVDPTTNRILNSVGDPQMTVRRQTFAPDDWEFLVLCSDGLIKELSDADILRVVQEHQDPARIVHHLLAETLRRGARDNTTIVVVEPQ
jgi:PPM family protein phosphatase